jgi:hypothetical protein
MEHEEEVKLVNAGASGEIAAALDRDDLAILAMMHVPDEVISSRIWRFLSTVVALVIATPRSYESKLMRIKLEDSYEQLAENRAARVDRRIFWLSAATLMLMMTNGIVLATFPGPLRDTAYALWTAYGDHLVMAAQMVAMFIAAMFVAICAANFAKYMALVVMKKVATAIAVFRPPHARFNSQCGWDRLYNRIDRYLTPMGYKYEI